MGLLRISKLVMANNPDNKPTVQQIEIILNPMVCGLGLPGIAVAAQQQQMVGCRRGGLSVRVTI